MQISIKHGLTFLSNPKCGTTSIEHVLKRKCEINLSGTKIGKHLDARQYIKHWNPFLTEQFPKQKFFVLCTTREPISKLISWYQYRSRSKIINSRRYLGNVDFGEWCKTNMLNSKPADYFFYNSSKNQLLVDLVVPISQFKRLDIFFQSTLGSSKFPRKNISIDIHPNSFAYSNPREKLFEIAREIYNELPKENLFRQSVNRHKKIEEFFENSNEQNLRALSEPMASFINQSY